MADKRILVVDDEKMICWSLAETLADAGYEVKTAGSGAEAWQFFESFTPQMVLLDICLPDTSGMDLLHRIKAYDENISVIMITAYSHLDSTVSALQKGADDYIGKPFKLNQVEKRVNDLFAGKDMGEEKGLLKGSSHYVKKKEDFDCLVGSSEQMIEVFKMVKLCGESDCKTVLILGESGTGKELIARAIHQYSSRKDQPFIDVNCSAIPDTLLENELFGHEKGAYTDAATREKGIFESASGGTIFFDEIGDMPLQMQAKILKAIENRSFRRVGGKENLTVDVRIVAATNCDLPELVKEGHFRSDLYYRLNVLTIRIPPLRERRNCIPTLVDYFIKRLNTEYAKKFTGVSDEAMAYLKAYSWPGNVRELRNALERAMMLDAGPMLTDQYLPTDIKCEQQQGPSEKCCDCPYATGRGIHLPPEGVTMEGIEKELIQQALARFDNNQTRAAQILGMSRDTLRYRMKKFDLS